ncbi:MAG: UTP--glucose-1-phosphate uridylyltransferase [Phycisphaerales bacterium]
MSTLETDVRSRLDAHGQSHLLNFLPELSESERAALFAQIAELDFELLDRLRSSDGASFSVPDAFEPAPVVGLDAADEREAARAVGLSLIRSGAVAAFTVAGGQGTRLGWRGPKGTFPAGVVTGKPLFRLFAEQILAASERYGVKIPWYIMPSPINAQATRDFFLDNNCFGLERRDIFMFPQGVMPSVDADGRVLMEAKGRVAVNPDGHGGSIRALRVSGALDDMTARGVEHISYFQVDNPLVHVMDPVFIGLHAAGRGSSGEMTSKIVRKTDPAEKVGVFARDGSRTVVVEYSDLPEARATERDADGSLRYDGGSIAIHMMSRAFIERIAASADGGLPFHRANKKVPHIDPGSGADVVPAEPNAIKYETFVFDALPMAEGSLVVETSRVEEFAPIKNADGADSESTSHALQSERAAAWLAACGVDVPRNADGSVNATIEISPLTALDPAALAEAGHPDTIEPGATVAI